MVRSDGTVVERLSAAKILNISFDEKETRVWDRQKTWRTPRTTIASFRTSPLYHRAANALMKCSFPKTLRIANYSDASESRVLDTAGFALPA